MILPRALDWCVKEFKDANHAPVAKVKGALKRDVKSWRNREA